MRSIGGGRGGGAHATENHQGNSPGDGASWVASMRGATSEHEIGVMVCVSVRVCVCARARSCARSCWRRSSSSRQVRSGQVRSGHRSEVWSRRVVTDYCILHVCWGATTFPHCHSATPTAVRPRHTTRASRLVRCAARLTHSHRRIYAFMVDEYIPSLALSPRP